MAAQEAIVVLERDKEVAIRIGDALVSRGYRIRDFNTAADAVQCSSECKPAAAFVDLALASERQGGFLQSMRAIHPLMHIVVMSAMGEPVDLIGLIRYGIDEHLRKPFAAADVHESLSRALHEDERGLEQAMAAIMGRLKATRRRLGLKQLVVAKRSGLSVAQVSQIESRASGPSLSSLLRICRALQTPLSEVVAGI